MSSHMFDYVYRIDQETGLQKIKDGVFRARAWTSNSPVRHEVLAQAKDSLPTSCGVFRLCFFVSHERAERARSEHSPIHPSPYRITRCPKDYVRKLGFVETWDDKFSTGEAYLFWCSEDDPQEEKEFSGVGVPLHLMEIWQDDNWLPLLQVMPSFPPAESRRSRDYHS